MCGSSAGPLGGLVKGKVKSVSPLDPSTVAHAERVYLIAFCRNLIFEATSSRKPALARGNRMAGSIGERTTKLKSIHSQQIKIHSFPVYHAGKEEQDSTVLPADLSVSSKMIANVCMVLASPICLTGLLKEKEVEEANAGGIKQAQKGRDQAKATTSTTVLHVEGKGADWQVHLTLTGQLLCIYASTLHPQTGVPAN